MSFDGKFSRFKSGFESIVFVSEIEKIFLLFTIEMRLENLFKNNAEDFVPWSMRTLHTWDICINNRYCEGIFFGNLIISWWTAWRFSCWIILAIIDSVTLAKHFRAYISSQKISIVIQMEKETQNERNNLLRISDKLHSWYFTPAIGCGSQGVEP